MQGITRNEVNRNGIEKRAEKCRFFFVLNETPALPVSIGDQNETSETELALPLI
jgi:hypothetical protein